MSHDSQTARFEHPQAEEKDPFDEALEALRTECEERDLEYGLYRKAKNAYWRPWVVCVYVGTDGREVARCDNLVMALTWAVATIRQSM